MFALFCFLGASGTGAFDPNLQENKAQLTSFRICYEQSANPPYTVMESPGKHSGILLDLISQSIASARLRPVFYQRSWKRCKNDLKSGVADATFAMIWTKERAQWARFPLNSSGELRREARLWRGIYRVFVHRANALSWDGKAFGHVLLGLDAPLGYIAYQKLEALGVLIPEPLGPVTGLRQVARLRLDGYVIEQQIGQYLANQLGLNARVRYLAVPFMESDWYLPISQQFYKKYPQKSEAIWNQLARLREQMGPALVQHYQHH